MRAFFALSIAVLTAVVFSTSTATQGQATPPQEQQILPPEARYWMGVTTLGGMTAMGGGMAQGGRPSMADMMRLAKGIPTAAHMVELRLGSTLAPTGGPEAYHTMPPGAQVNQPIYLETPQPGGPSAPSAPEPYRVPKGQITFYWGCGETAGPGQPVVLTFDKLMRGENDPELQALAGAVQGRAVNKPTPATSKTYGEWPHADRQQKNRNLRATFAEGSSVAGPHAIKATYAPAIEFTLPNGQSYMDAVRYTSTAVQGSGALALAWGAVARATGYSVALMAPERMNDDSANMVMWTSAGRPATFIQNEDLTPAEVNRLIGLNAVLPPTTTSCAIPAEVMKVTREGSMLMFTAFGDQATYIHPPRPEDQRVPWDQEWFSRVSFKSTRMDMVTQKGVMDLSTMSGSGGASAPSQNAQSDEEYCKQLEAERQKQGGLAGAVGGRVGRLFGGRRQEEPAPDPRCVKK